ncbi:hypothetical protein JXA88_18005 [Candidatus Fermentibacteria bacterium]|nr:hypothetical protein [Candidatus Fermentibacteria bacterium]
MRRLALSLPVAILTLSLLAAPVSATTLQDLIDWVKELMGGSQAGDATSPTGAWQPLVVTCTYTDIMGNIKDGYKIVCEAGSNSCSATLCG